MNSAIRETQLELLKELTHLGQCRQETIEKLKELLADPVQLGCKFCGDTGTIHGSPCGGCFDEPVATVTSVEERFEHGELIIRKVGISTFSHGQLNLNVGDNLYASPPVRVRLPERRERDWSVPGGVDRADGFNEALDLVVQLNQMEV